MLILLQSNIDLYSIVPLQRILKINWFISLLLSLLANNGRMTNKIYIYIYDIIQIYVIMHNTNNSKFLIETKR